MTAGPTIAQRYQHVQFSTADRGRLLMLMFEGALKFLARADRALAAGNLADFGHNLGRAQAVIAELMHTLDHVAGGVIAANLERLYQFMLDHLVEANLQKSARHVTQVSRLLEVIAGAYETILAQGAAHVDAA
jgi:flagellar protein FliS